MPKAASIGADSLWASGLVDLAIFKGRRPKSRIAKKNYYFAYLGVVHGAIAKKKSQGGFHWGNFPLGPCTCGLSDFQRSGAKKSDRIFFNYFAYLEVFHAAIPKKSFFPKAASIGLFSFGPVHLWT